MKRLAVFSDGLLLLWAVAASAQASLSNTATDGSLALLRRASTEEDHFEFGKAAVDYRKYLKSAKSEINDDKIRQKILTLSWLAGNPKMLRAALAQRSVCSRGFATQCDRYRALLALEDGAKGHPDATPVFRRLHSGAAANRALWAAVGLARARRLGFHDRNVLIEEFAAHWDRLDPLARYAVLPFIARSVPEALRANRIALDSIAPVRVDHRALSRRIRAIHALENAATAAAKLPWAAIRGQVLNEMAWAYLDFGHKLRAIPPPAGMSVEDLNLYGLTITNLVAPFEEKGQGLRRQAVEIASRFAIDDQALHAIVEPFIREKASRLHQNRRPSDVEEPRKLDVSFALSLETTPSPWVVSWASALRRSNWGLAAYDLETARAKNSLPEGELGVLRGVSLAQAGAVAEGLVELENARKHLNGGPKGELGRVLSSYYAHSYALAGAGD